MFELEKAVGEWREELRRAGVKRPEVLEELESHLREHTKNLIATGVREADAFQKAKEALGDSTLLKQEFSKVSNVGLVSSTNPIWLNLLALWFALRGLEMLVDWRDFFAYLYSHIFFIDSSSLHQCFFVTGWSLFYLSLAIGLYRRQNFSRYCVLGWSALTLGVEFVQFLTYPAFHLPYPVMLGYMMKLEVMHFPAPELFRVWVYLRLPVLIGGIYYLRKPEVRALFRPAIRFHHA